MGKKNKRQRAQNRINEGANVSKKMRTPGSSFSKKKARAVEKTMQQELAKRKKQEEQRKLKEQAKKSTIRKKQARVPYLPSDWILLIGEGNFSFARALGRLFEKEPLKTGRIVATSYDSFKELQEKYPESTEILEELTRLGVTVLHGIDATSLHTPSPLHSAIHRLVLEQQQQPLTFFSAPASSITTATSAAASSSFTAPSEKQLESVAYVETEEDEEDEGEEHQDEGDEEGEGGNDNEEVYEDEEEQVEVERQEEDEGAEGDQEQEEEEEEIETKGPVNVFNKIVFNFPHTGCGVKDTVENNRIHQKFMLQFFASAAHVLRPPSAAATPVTEEDLQDEKTHSEVSGKDRHRWERDNKMKEKKALELKNKKNKDGLTPGLKFSEIHITLKQGEPYSSWQVPRVARNAGFRARSGLDFFPELYPGYEHRRTRGVARENPNEFIMKAGQAQSVGAAKTYVFVPIIPKDTPA